MSHNKHGARRLNLLAGSSLILAGLFTFTGAAVAPSAASAQATCASPPAPAGNGTTGVTIAAGTYNPGITCAYVGTGATVTTAGAVAVSTTVGGDGVNLSGTGAGEVNWDSAAGTLTGGAQTNGPVIDATSVSGAINIITAEVAGDTATHGIRATSTGGGNISISRSTGSIYNNGQAAIEAVTNGGHISITTGGSTSGGQRGIAAQTSGAGTVSITANGGVTSSSGTMIGATTQAGNIVVNTAGTTDFFTGNVLDYGINAQSTAGGSISINTANVQILNADVAIRALASGGNGAVAITTGGPISSRLRGILAETSGTGALTITARGSVEAGNLDNSAAIEARSGAGLLRIDLDNSTGGTTAITTVKGRAIVANAGGNAEIVVDAGRIISQSNVSGFNPTVVLMELTSAGSTTVNNAGTIQTLLDERRLARVSAGSFTLVNDGLIRGQFDLAAVTGNTIFRNRAGGTWSSQGMSTSLNGSADLVENAGKMMFTGVTELMGLESFANSGVIYMGIIDGGETNGETNFISTDVLRLGGATFTGSGASRIIMDVSFSRGQTDCSAPTAADCLQIVNGATAGSTALTINSLDGSVSGSSSPIVVVEGSTAADHFRLAPDSTGYAETAQGAVIERRLFGYRLVYDAENQNHYLIGVPLDHTFQFATFAASAQEIWRTTSSSWFDRQADLRAAPGGLQPSHGVWARAGAGSSERSARPTSVANGGASGDASYNQRTAHLMFGLDVLGAASERHAWVLGVAGALVRADAEFDSTETEVAYAGASGTVYASYMAGPLFVDASVTGSRLNANADMPTLGLQDEVQLTQTIKSVGGRVDLGWRFAVADGFFVEPLTGMAYVATSQDDIVVPDASGEIVFDDEAKSFRAGAGLRVGADTALGSMPASFSLTGRYWNELEGENTATLGGTAPTMMTDDFSGSFGELIGSVNLYGEDGAVSGFLNLGGRFADDYSSVDTALGVRLRW